MFTPSMFVISSQNLINLLSLYLLQIQWTTPPHTRLSWGALPRATSRTPHLPSQRSAA